MSVSTKDSLKQPAIIQLYEYDKNGNRVSLKAGLKGEDEESYFTNSYTYDLENQLTRLRSPAGAFDFEYDDLSRITKMTYPNNMTTEMSFEGDFRLSKVEHIKQGSLFNQVQSLFKYDYDNNDNKTQMKTFRRTLPINETLNYTYDRKDQLLTATSPLLNQADESFTYDIVGNLLRKQGQSKDSTYNENNQLIDDGVYTYLYDTWNYLFRKKHKVTGEITRYYWDPKHQLIAVAQRRSERAIPHKLTTYEYDALGRRIEKNINGKITRYVYDNEDILMEFDGENAFQKYYVHGMGIDDPLAMVVDNKDTRDDLTDLRAYYYHKDGMNSITSLTDENGNEKEKYIYNAFGKMTIYDERDNKIEESQLGNPYSFTGREYDSETGLHYHRARYYDPDLARWISEDPIEFNGGDLNLYRYVMNNPVNYFDPDGYKPYGSIITACKLLNAKIARAIRAYKKFEKCMARPEARNTDTAAKALEQCKQQFSKDINKPLETPNNK
ncbi:MAG: RHS repeat-associated core domain-containing protein [Oligoflexia bacterium]|nr:RHS repeat-associated core domain-containing protein [Oligoflexia bacterium]